MDQMCSECSGREKCSRLFGVTSTQCNTFNSTFNVLKSKCDLGIKTVFEGSASCEILGMIAEGLMDQCGPICGLNEHVQVNINENALYCACDGKCQKDYRDSTLNGLLITLIVLFLIQFFFNSFIMFNNRFAKSSNIAILGTKSI